MSMLYLALTRPLNQSALLLNPGDGDPNAPGLAPYALPRAG